MLWSFKFNLLNVFFRFVDFLYRIFIIVGNEASISWLVTLLEVTCILHPWMAYRLKVVSSWSAYQFWNASCLVSTVTVPISFVREAWHDYLLWTSMRFDVNRILHYRSRRTIAFNHLLAHLRFSDARDAIESKRTVCHLSIESIRHTECCLKLNMIFGFHRDYYLCIPKLYSMITLLSLRRISCACLMRRDRHCLLYNFPI